MRKTFQQKTHRFLFSLSSSHSIPIFLISIFKRIMSLLRIVIHSIYSIPARPSILLKGHDQTARKEFVHAKTRSLHPCSFVSHIRSSFLFAGNQLVVDNRLITSIEYIYIYMLFFRRLSPSAYITNEHHHAGRIFFYKNIIIKMPGTTTTEIPT